MRIVKNLSDLSLNEDQTFFAEIIRDEFGYDTCVEDIKNKDFLIQYNGYTRKGTKHRNIR